MHRSLWLPIALVVGLNLMIAASNRHPVLLHLWPFGTLSVPMFLVLYGALFIGILLGGLWVWRMGRDGGGSTRSGWNRDRDR